MNIILIKIIVTVLGALLKFEAETVWHNAQRFILPIIYSVAVSYLSNNWWLGLTTLPMMVPFSFGYKRYGSKDSVARALWLFVICVVTGLGPTIFGYMPIWVYGIYIVVAGFVGTLTRNIDNRIEAPVCGAWVMVPIWWIGIKSMAKVLHG